MFCGTMCVGRADTSRAVPADEAPKREERQKAGDRSASPDAGPGLAEPAAEANHSMTLKEQMQATAGKAAALKHAASDKAQALKHAAADKAQALKHKDAPKEEGTEQVQKETMQVTQDFVNWLTGGSGKHSKKSDVADDSRQTVLKTVQKFSGVEISIDPSPAVRGQRKVILKGDDEQRQKAKSMMNDLSSRGSVNEGSLMGMVDAWGDIGGNDARGDIGGMNMGTSRGVDSDYVAGYPTYFEPAKKDGSQELVSISHIRRQLMKREGTVDR